MIGFILNLPYTAIGLVAALFSVPTGIKFITSPYAIIIYVTSLWWVLGYMKGARAMAIGHVVILGPSIEDKDLEHELIHIEQYEKEPLVHPFLYCFELLIKGYKNNKYEIEAYRRSGNKFKDLNI